MFLSLDTECTGLDLRHGAKPFLVTICNDASEQTWWEWPVDPLTRQPVVPPNDLYEIQRAIDKADFLVLQNPKYDVTALQTVFKGSLNWDWGKVYDTLLAGHLLESNGLHDLTSMALIYLGVDVKPWEDKLEVAVKESRKLAEDIYPNWRIAKKGLPEMPSVKEKVWKSDIWLPTAIANEQGYPHGECEVVNKKRKPFDVYIGRGSDWGNPFVIGKDGNRRAVINKYRRWIQKQPTLLKRIPELDGKRLGCFCKPRVCHGDVLAELLSEHRHPWYDVGADYANSDSETTLAVFKQQRKLLKERGLWRIYLERLKVLPIVHQIEDHGITLSKVRLGELNTECKTESEKAEGICNTVADSYDFKLELPKGASNNSLRAFIFDVLKLISSRYSDKTGDPSLDKFAVEDWIATLPKTSRALRFIKALQRKRKRDTALSFIESYKKFWLPVKPAQAGWCMIYSSLNPTGTDTLRFSSSNPNAQQISKQEETNLRYCFGPAPGREWWSLDAKNIELRIPAYEAGETEMIDLFERETEGPYYGSVHMLMFAVLHPDKFARDKMDCKKKYAATWYQWTKNGDFAVQYGSVEQSGTADRAYHVPGAFQKIKSRFKQIHGPGGLNERMIAHADKYGYVETMPDKTVNPNHGYPLRCSRSNSGKVLPTVPLNYHVQGTAMWWMMKGMIRCQAYLDKLNARPKSPGYHMIMQVHDELVFDFPAGKKYNLLKVGKLRMLMEKGGDDIGIPTPVSIEYHPNNWGEGETI